jgi:hypothetical protein
MEIMILDMGWKKFLPDTRLQMPDFRLMMLLDINIKLTPHASRLTTFTITTSEQSTLMLRLRSAQATFTTDNSQLTI